MKKFLFLSALMTMATETFAAGEANLLVVDSSFPPIVNPKLSFRPATCRWAREDEVAGPIEGPCYDVAEWSELTSEDVGRLKGLIDTLSGSASAEAKVWQHIESSVPAEAQRVKGRYLLSVHGTRAIAVATLASQGKVRPLAFRSLSSKAGADVVQNQSATPTLTPKRKPYDNGCGLQQWTMEDFQAFQKGELREFQKRIAAQLDEMPSLKVVNLSLGYKRSWIKEDHPKCSPEQVEKEYGILTAAWRNLFRRFPDRLFVVAAGNESENFDRADLRDNDLWARLATTPNLLVVGAMTASGTRLTSSNFGLPVHVFALGELIPALTPLPTVIAGHASRLQGTSFSAPLVSGRAVALWQASPQLSSEALRAKLIESLQTEQFRVLFGNFEKLCRGEKALDPCLETIAELISRPLLWSNTHLLYLKGREDWLFRPFPVQFQKDLPVLGQTKLINFNGEYIPSLILKPSDNPYELLITIHHEVYHFSSMKAAANSFTDNKRVKQCVTPYQLELLKDELPAYEEETRFFESAPVWFRKKLTGKKYRSELLNKKIDAPNFYKELKAATKRDPKFLVKRFVDLGAYPPCVLDLF